MTIKVQLKREVNGVMQQVNPITSEECVILGDGKKLNEVIDFATTAEDFVDETIVIEENLVDRVESMENKIETEFEQQNSQIATGLSNIKTIEQNISNKVDTEVAKVNAQLSDIMNKKIRYVEKQQTLLSKFHNKLIKNEKVSIGMYGDSMTYGYDVTSEDVRGNKVIDNAGNSYSTTIASKTFPEAFKEVMDEVYGPGIVDVVVRAIGGDYVSKALERWIPSKYPIGTDVSIINYGINDSRNTNCPYVGNTDEFLKYYRQLIETELDNGTAIILMTPFKVSKTDYRIQIFETAVLNLAKEYQIPVIIGDEMAANMSYKWYSDATHWNGEGYKYVGTRIASCFIGDGLINPTIVSENTQLLTRRQIDGVWWAPGDGGIYQSNSTAYPTPDESADKKGVALRIGENSTVYYSFYAEKDLWIAPFLGFNDSTSHVEVKLNFGLESPDYSFDSFPILGESVDFSVRAITSIDYTKDMPKSSSRIHVGSILVDELPCLRTVTKGWHTVSITARDGSMGLGGLVFLDVNYFETIRNRYTKFRNNIELHPVNLNDAKALTIIRQKKDESDIFRGNYGLFSYDSDTKMGAGVALYDYNDTSNPSMLSVLSVDDVALILRKYTGGAFDSGGMDIGSNAYKTKDIYSINGITQVSDKSLKDNITDTDLGLDFINQLRPVNYTLKNGTSGRIHTGLIAQEVEQVLGENDKALLIKSNTVDENTGEENVSYSLRYAELIGPIIKAIQELDEKISLIK